LPADFRGLMPYLCPDQGLSLQFGPVLAGLTDNPEAALASVFDRMVSSQGQHPHAENRTDEQVWSRRYQQPLARSSVSKVLKPRTFSTSALEIQFKHTFKNDRWHVLQPVSFDYLTRETVQNKASRWL